MKYLRLSFLAQQNKIFTKFKFKFKNPKSKTQRRPSLVFLSHGGVRKTKPLAMDMSFYKLCIAGLASSKQKSKQVISEVEKQLGKAYIKFLVSKNL